ncbi:DUF4097 family beta strand repeat-containing protein [Marilutibacter spongiae]|uniref:DUF4097 family beta strand repeat protein n=1 Tax=Marilutibacter spongiae TaxID=2025720 RepID=A0A7W3TIY3_9GAMM|nr:DUF4097 family beta strand repeat-containing protein [Lysobacter spongiae]MBB1059187.1 DUF4097 family beta strand repeat protein [Lysobacter spongiae]
MTRFQSIASPVLASALFVAALPALAGTPINETRPLDPRGSVDIDNLKGRIEVRAWDRAEVQITGTLGKGVEKLEITGDKRHLDIEVKYPNRGSGLGFFTSSDKSEPSDLVVMVPLRANLEIDSVSADIDVAGVAPDSLSIDTVSGDATVAGAPGELSVDSVSGDLKLTVNSRNVSIDSVSGDIRLSGRLDGEVAIDSVSGEVEVRVIDSQLRRFSGETVSGDFDLRTALAPNARIDIESVSGDVDLHFPRSLSATVKASSFSGDLSAPDANIERPRHGPGASFTHRYGGGDADINLESFSGDVTLQFDY